MVVVIISARALSRAICTVHACYKMAKTLTKTEISLLHLIHPKCNVRVVSLAGAILIAVSKK